MSIPLKLGGWSKRSVLVAFLFSITAWAVTEPHPIHWSGDKTIWNRKTNVVDLYGNALVRQEGEVLRADFIRLDLNARTLNGKGNCHYIAFDSVIESEEIYFNLDTRTGAIVNGRVSNERFILSGERINRLSEKRFQAHLSDYTTCRDCASSWAMHAKDVDLTLEGYAFLSDVTMRIKDAPAFWLPYMIFPVKTERQTGFLFPRFGNSQFGFRFVLPFFWAISRSTDMTVGLGYYGGQGKRFEWEGRYKLSEKDEAQANVFYLRDKQFTLTQHRWAVSLTQRQELPWKIDEKLRLTDVSDNFYPSTILNDVPGRNEAYLTSDLIFSRSTPYLSSYLSFRRFRDLLHINPEGFNPETVQALPTAQITTNEKFLFNSNVAAGLTLALSNFTRTAGPFDRDPFSVASVTDPNDFRPGIDPIREATRLSITPSLYTSIRPWDIFTLEPSAEYRAFVYNFRGDARSLTRGYLLLKADLSTQLEKIYETENPEIPRLKHLIRPTLTYNLIPLVNQPSHPFIQQIDYARSDQGTLGGFSGYNFDNNDIVPIDQSRSYSNYFVPLGNSISYGFVSQLIRRRGSVEKTDPSYQRSVEFRSGQTINFRELRRSPSDRQPLSRVFSSLLFEFDQMTASADHTYVPYIPITDTQKRHVLSTSFNYFLERGVRERVLEYNRSISLNHYYNTIGSQISNFRGRLTFSINDYLLPSVYADYEFFSEKMTEVGGFIRYQSPSQCWRFEVQGKQFVCEQSPNGCRDIRINLSINFSGSGFSGINEVSQGNFSGT